MKIKQLFLLSGALVLIASCMSMSMAGPGMKMEMVGTSFADGKQPGKAEEIIKNQDIIEIDTIAFETHDLLGIRQKLGQEIATYQRIPNPNYTVSSAKLFTPNGKSLYTLVPNVDQFGVHIYIKNNQGQRGNIDITAKAEMGGFTSMNIKYTINTNFFTRPYTFHFYEKSVMTAGFSPDQKTNGQYVLYYENIPVLAYVTQFDLSHPESNKITIIADHDFFIAHKHDLAAWCVIFVLIQDVNEQLAEEARKRNANRSFMDDDFYSDDNLRNDPHNPHDNFPHNTPPPTRWNNDGSIDNNNNPFDSF